MTYGPLLLLEDDDLDESICSLFKCPITDMIIFKPVVAKDGFIYEKYAIEKWFQEHQHSPVTTKWIGKDLIPCIPFELLINNFLESHPEYKKLQFEPSWNHADNVQEVNRLIIQNNFEKLMNFTNFMAKHLFSSYYHLVSYCTNEKVIRHIIDNLDDLNYKGCLIYSICDKANIKFLKYLLEKPNVDLEITTNSNGKKPIHIVCSKRSLNMLELLAEKGINLEATDDDGRTPAHYACINGCYDQLKFLMDRKVNLEFKDTVGYTPVKHLLDNGNIQCLELMVERGLILTKTDINNYGLDRFACKHDNIKFLRYLNDIANKSKEPLNTSDLILIANNIEIIKYLLEIGANINCQDENGRTPLIKACMYNNFEIAKLLIFKGANIDLKNNNNARALHYACYYGSSELIKYLIEHGANLYGTINLSSFESWLDDTTQYTVEDLIRKRKDNFDFTINQTNELISLIKAKKESQKRHNRNVRYASTHITKEKAKEYIITKRELRDQRSYQKQMQKQQRIFERRR